MRAVKVEKQLSLSAQGNRRQNRGVPRPFVKWVGGKTQLLEQLTARAPTKFGRYFEPFVGGGALFFDLHPKSAVLTDVNEELVNAYTVIRDDVEGLIRALLGYEYDEEQYYAARALEPKKLKPVARAARTIYLNRTGYNGLYRVNKSGGFNVPFGRYTDPLICDAPNLRACSERLAGVELAVRPFDEVLAHAKKGDFVYFDPPYFPTSRTADFTTYSAGGFGLAQQERLAEIARLLVKKKVHVLLSNADVPAARALYEGMTLTSVSASRRVSSDASNRADVRELIITG